MNWIYQWSAVSMGGQRLAGRVAAGSEREARQHVVAQGLSPISVDLDIVGTVRSVIHPNELPVKALADCFQFLAESSELELPLAEMLLIAQRSTENKPLKEHLAKARVYLSQGASYSDAVERAGGVPVFAIQLLRTAEQTGAPGALAEAFGSLRDHYRIHAEFVRRTRRAVFQPAITAAIVFLVVVFVVTVLVPRLRPLFMLFKDLPWLAQAIFSIAEAVSNNLLLSGGVVLAIGVGVFHQRRQIAALLPGVEALLAAIGAFQLCTALSLLIKSGFPAARAVAVAGAGLGGEIAQKVAVAATRVSHGAPLSAALAGVGLRQEVLETIRRKEQVGQLDQGLAQAAAFYRRFVEDRFDVLATNVGLVLTFLAAGLLVVVGVAIFLPLYAGIGSLSVGVN